MSVAKRIWTCAQFGRSLDVGAVIEGGGVEYGSASPLTLRIVPDSLSHGQKHLIGE